MNLAFKSILFCKKHKTVAIWDSVSKIGRQIPDIENKGEWWNW